MKSTLQCSEEFRRVSEKNGSQIHYYTFQTKLVDFWAAFLPFGITRWMWSPLCIAVRNFEDYMKKMDSYTVYYTFQTELTDFWASFLPFGITRWCEVHFIGQGGLSKVVWKEWCFKYTIILFRLNCLISELPSCLLELQNDVESTLQSSKDFRRLSEKIASQIYYYTF